MPFKEIGGQFIPKKLISIQQSLHNKIFTHLQTDSHRFHLQIIVSLQKKNTSRNTREKNPNKHSLVVSS